MSEIYAEVKRTVNLGNYESTTYTFGVTETVPADSNPAKHWFETTDKLEKAIRKKLLELDIVTEV